MQQPPHAVESAVKLAEAHGGKKKAFKQGEAATVVVAATAEHQQERCSPQQVRVCVAQHVWGCLTCTCVMQNIAEGTAEAERVAELNSQAGLQVSHSDTQAGGTVVVAPADCHPLVCVCVCCTVQQQGQFQLGHSKHHSTSTQHMGCASVCEACTTWSMPQSSHCHRGWSR